MVCILKYYNPILAFVKLKDGIGTKVDLRHSERSEESYACDPWSVRCPPQDDDFGLFNQICSNSVVILYSSVLEICFESCVTSELLAALFLPEADTLTRPKNSSTLFTRAPWERTYNLMSRSLVTTTIFFLCTAPETARLM